MRNVWGFFLLALVTLSAPAHAQFANKSLGFEVGFIDMQAPNEGIRGIAVPIGLTGSLYLDDHWELEAHAGALIYKYASLDHYQVGLDVGVGVRYLFLEENIRPYVGFEILPLFLLSQTNPDAVDANNNPVALTGTANTQTFLLGLSPMVGVEFFLSPGISIGLRAQFDALLSLDMNKGLDYAIAVTPYISAYF